jgi:hypothetical protein
MTTNVAIETMQAQRPNINPLPHFRQQIVLYELQCRQKKVLSGCQFDMTAFHNPERHKQNHGKGKATNDDPLISKAISNESKTTIVGSSTSPQKVNNRPRIGPMLPQGPSSELKPTTQIGPSDRPPIGPSLPTANVFQDEEKRIEEIVNDADFNRLSTIKTKMATLEPRNDSNTKRRRIIGPTKPS